MIFAEDPHASRMHMATLLSRSMTRWIKSEVGLSYVSVAPGSKDWNTPPQTPFPSNVFIERPELADR